MMMMIIVHYDVSHTHVMMSLLLTGYNFISR